MNAKKCLNYVSIFSLAAILCMGVLQCRDVDSQAAKSKADSKISALSGPDAAKTCNSGPVVSAAQELGLKSVLILLDTRDQPSFETVESKVQELGGKVTVSMAPKSLFALIPPETESAIRALPEVRLISSNPYVPDKAPGLTGAQKKLLDGWNRSLTNNRERTLTASPKPLIHDAKTRPLLNPASIKSHAPREIPSDSGGPADLFPEQEPQAAYAPVTTMSNTVAIAIFFPESDGVIDPNKENWTQSQIDTALAKIAAASDWWATKAPTSQKLSFKIYKSYTPFNSACAKTSYEPINNSSMDEGLWIQQVMHCLGYGPATLAAGSTVYFTSVDSFNTWMKGAAKAKQAFSIFVVNDTLVSSHAFTDGYFAYAYLGGPFQVLTYNNDGYGIGNMDAVAAHETGHIFNALDEYYESGCSCSETQLSCANENCDNSCRQNVCCIMRGDVPPFLNNCNCACTKGQIGWGCAGCGTQTCSFVITSPATGQIVTAGSQFNITWTTSGNDCASDISLYYTPNGQQIYELAFNIANTGSFAWTVPAAATAHAKLLVTDSAAFGVTEEFTVSACGNGVCDISESHTTCPQDCPSPPPSFSQDTGSGHPGGMCGIWMIEGSSPTGAELGLNLILLALPLAILFYLKSRSGKQARKNVQT